MTDKLTLINFQQKLSRLSVNKQFCLAYSGGLDSHVLLHLLAACAREDSCMQIRAIHIDHGLNPQADNWANHCLRMCADLNIECLVEKVNAKAKTSQSPEEAARQARYQALAISIKPHECLLTAHTENDQAETLLLQLLRGAGVKGLAAMPEKILFGNGYLLRPLLTNTRQQLQAYAQAHTLAWVEDDSNFQQKFARNYIRHQLMPKLAPRWPAVTRTLSRAARHCAEADQLLAELAALDLAQVEINAGKNLSIAALLTFNENRQKNILRYWLRSRQLPLPSEIKLRQIQQDILLARAAAKAKVHWSGVEIRRYGDALYAMPPLPNHDNQLVFTWNVDETLSLPNNLGELTLANMPQLRAMLSNQMLTVRFRQGSERCTPLDRQGSHPLKKLLQEWRVPPWLRDRVPLLYQGQQLIAVVGYCICRLEK